METNSQNSMPVSKTVSVKVFGVGGAGVKVLEQLSKNAPTNVSFVAVNTDAQSLLSSTAAEKICLESKLMRGLGTGGDPERGRAAAEQNLPALKNACAGADVIFVVTGLGGGAGTGVSPVLAKVAKESGALVLAFAALPFDCEGNRRQRQALEGLEELKAVADGVITLPNQKLFKLIDENTTAVDTFKLSNELLTEGAASIWRLIGAKGLIDISFEELCAFLRERQGESLFASAEAAGATRSREAIDKLLAHPMLDGGKILSDADAVLVSIMSGSDLTMIEINRVMEHINGKCEKAQVIMGAAVNPQFQERLQITVIATRRSEPAAPRSVIIEAASPATIRESEFDTQLHTRKTSRPQSRFVPPPPTLTPDKMEQLAGTQTTTSVRGRKVVQKKMRQEQLPLEIISKGRFDKSEPTIHKGEDLDVPTYIRRGVSLN